MSVRRASVKCGRTGSEVIRWVVDVNYVHANGRNQRVRKISPVQTRRGAEAYEQQLRLSLLSGEYGKEVPLFKDFAGEFMRGYVKANNKPSEASAKEGILRVHLVPRFGTHLLDEITEHLIERFKGDQLNKGLSAKTVNNHLTVLRTMLNVAVEWKVLERVPAFRRLRATKPEYDFLTFKETERLIEAAADEPFWQSMIIVALNTGLRAGELLALRWDDINLSDKLMWVRRTDWRGHVGVTKSGKERIIPLNDAAVEALKAQRHLRGDRIWSHPDGERLDHYNLKPALKRIAKRASLRPFQWHVLRHTFASQLTMRGVPLKAVQELLGHSTIEMTMRYSHLSPDVRRDAVEILMNNDMHNADRGYGKGTARNSVVPIRQAATS